MAEVQAELQALKASRQRHAEQQKDQVSLHKLVAHILLCCFEHHSVTDALQHAEGGRRTHTAVENIAISLPVCTSNANLTCSSNTRGIGTSNVCFSDIASRATM